MLKMLNGLIKPDTGMIEMRGRVGSLIELGAGFNPVLTGRENIYVNGAILGFTRAEIEQKIDRIIEFSGIREFLDTPVQYYSSGMKVRLGFAIAAQMEPDILIIDEVLAVGDMDFRIKCLTRIGELASKTAIIFVSHSMPQVARVCNRLILMQGGHVKANTDDVSLGIEEYFRSVRNGDKIVGENTLIRLCWIRLLQSGNREPLDAPCELYYGKPFDIECCFDVADEVSKYWINFAFIDRESKPVANIFSFFGGMVFEQKGNVKIRASIDRFLLSQGSYSLSIAVNEVTESGTRGKVYFYDSNVLTVIAKDIGAANAPVQLFANWSVVE
jgi:lipopolysaccharide transport system ATP-binding protein